MPFQRSIKVKNRPVGNVPQPTAWRTQYAGTDVDPIGGIRTKKFGNPAPFLRDDCIIFEDSHPFSKKNKLRELFRTDSENNLVVNSEDITFEKCDNTQQLFVMLCLSSIKQKLSEQDYVLLPAIALDRQNKDTKRYNTVSKQRCQAYFLDLDGINAQELLKNYNSERELKTQMAKLNHVKELLRKSTSSSMIVGFIQANAESMEYVGLQSKYCEDEKPIDNLMVTSIGLNEMEHQNLVVRNWFNPKKEWLFDQMNGEMYLDVSSFFCEKTEKNALVSIYIRKKTTRKTGEVIGEDLQRICQPIQSSNEAFNSFENGMKITRVNWCRTRKPGQMKELVKLETETFEGDYLEVLKGDDGFKDAVKRIYANDKI